MAATVAVAMTIAACGSTAESEDTGGAANGGTTTTAEMSDTASGASDTTADGTSAAGDSSSRSSPGAQPQTVRLVTHDSFAADPDVLADFQRRTGITIKILAQGDAGAMLSKVILTKENPLGDVVFGIDNTFASKALKAGVLQPYRPADEPSGAEEYAVGDGHELTPIDFGDVCVNIDHAYFAEHDLAEPTTFEDLAEPQYKDMLVTEDAATSSPGLAFLLATIGHFGADGWQEYWTSLKDNGVKVDSGWTDAYTVDFSGSTGKGDRPLVVSYASSPPSEVPDGATEAPTGALLDTCFRQVEYAGVLAGTDHAKAAGDVIDFLLSPEFQAQIPEQMYMYPVDRSVDLPETWQKFAPVASDPETVDPADIAQHRQEWITTWTDLLGR